MGQRRGAEQRAPKAGGAGAGLPIARQIASLHGGALMLESRPGEGLRAAVSLPVRRPDRTHTLRSPPPAVDGTGGFSSVLVELSGVLPWQAFRRESVE